jgi:hypothetical protein
LRSREAAVSAPPAPGANPEIDVTADGEIVLVLGEARVPVPDPYRLQRDLRAAIARRISILGPHAEHLGPIAGD